MLLLAMSSLRVICRFDFTPDENENGTPYSDFTYTVSDGTNDSAPAP